MAPGRREHVAMESGRCSAAGVSETKYRRDGYFYGGVPFNVSSGHSTFGCARAHTPDFYARGNTTIRGGGESDAHPATASYDSGVDPRRMEHSQGTEWQYRWRGTFRFHSGGT